MTYPFPRRGPGSISAYDSPATVGTCSYPLIQIENSSTVLREYLGRLYFCLHRGKADSGRSVLLLLDPGFVTHMTQQAVIGHYQSCFMSQDTGFTSGNIRRITR